MKKHFNALLYKLLTSRKYRVKIITDGKGDVTYIPQYRNVFWFSFQEYTFTIKFKIESHAWEYIRGSRMGLSDYVKKFLIKVTEFKYEE